MLFSIHSKGRRHGVLLDHPQNGDQRCFRCGGDCCRSFSDVELTWEEFERLRQLGASRLQMSLSGPHRLMIDYNCEFLSDGRCLIYEARPGVCQRFTCVDT